MVRGSQHYFSFEEDVFDSSRNAIIIIVVAVIIVLLLFPPCLTYVVIIQSPIVTLHVSCNLLRIRFQHVFPLNQTSVKGRFSLNKITEKRERNDSRHS